MEHVMPSRLVGITALLLFMVGCASTDAPPPAATLPATKPSADASTAEPAANRAQSLRGAATAPAGDVLASGASSYAQMVERWLAERAAARPATRPAMEPRRDGGGTIDSSAFGLALDPLAPIIGRTTPVMFADPAANRAASIAPAATLQPAVSVAGPKAAGPSTAPVTPAAEELERRLRQHVRDFPRDLCAHLDLQLLLLLRDEPAPQLPTIAPLPPEDRELVAAVVDAMSNFRNAVRADPNMLSARKIRPVIELADRLKAQADLRIPTLALCTKVDGFGNYEPIEPARFTAGKDQAAILYCEVENFASQLNERQLWETRLTQEAVLYTETGLPVWHDKSRPVVDLARNRRHDFYLVKKVVLPSTLTINRYILKVSIVDQQANRVAEATLPIQMVAQ
jgi:hypothetical protein